MISNTSNQTNSNDSLFFDSSVTNGNKAVLDAQLRDITIASLGITTKFASRPETEPKFDFIKINGVTYSNKRYERISADLSSLKPLHEDFTIKKFEMLKKAASLLPEKRVGKICMKHIAWSKSHVEIVKHQNDKHSYKNLAACGSVWDCPICSSRISEQRRQELSLATAKADVKVLMGTYTMQHHQGESLTEVLARVQSAYRMSKNGRNWQRIKKKYKIIGTIRALEITWGVNGWHPHIHELLLLEPHDYDMKELQSEIRTRWAHCVEFRGGWVNRAIGFTLKDDNEFVKDYVAKFGKLPTKMDWDLVAEVTKAVVKKGKRNGLNPMMLLELATRGSATASQLFKEYSEAMHSKNQLVWSGGLKKLLGIAEIKDQQAAEMDDEAQDIELVATIDAGTWFNILKTNNRANVLIAANELPRKVFLQYLESFNTYYYLKNWRENNDELEE